MENLARGVAQFQKHAYPSRRALYEKLAGGQSPSTLFITCSDSRIDPSLLTQTDPGDLFVVRNAGNLVPAFAADGEGTGAAIEFAVVGLEVKHIIICGHSDCGAMKGLLNPEKLETMPQVAGWLRHAEAVRTVLSVREPKAEGKAFLKAAIEENVRAQMTNLETHPSVAAALAAKKVTIHGWVYDIGRGAVSVFDPLEDCFVAIDGGKSKDDGMQEVA